MWTRQELKSNAKEVLRRTYWMSLAVSLVGGLLAGAGSGGNSSSFRFETISDNPAIYLVVMAFAVIGIIFSIFVGGPIMVGKNDYYMSSREYDPSFMKLFSSFTKGQYLNTVKTMFLRDLYTVLWTVLFIIPGIIKFYQYYFVPYIMCENPAISSRRAFEISKEMTSGHKMDIFILQVSFLGWYLLGLLACCIGVIFVTPYVEATTAELYEAHRAQALAEGYADATELCGF